MVTEIVIEKMMAKGEQYSEPFYEKTKLYLPFIARLLLLSHFVQDNIIIFYHWDKIQAQATEFWATVIAVMFAICFIARTVGFAMALLRIKVTVACGLLLGSAALQLLSIQSIPHISSILVNASVFGSLFFLLAESKEETTSQPSYIEGIPENSRKPQDYLKLIGRCFIMLLFINFITLRVSLFHICLSMLSFTLMVLVVLGYRTRLTVLITITSINFFNYRVNHWWTIEDDPHRRMMVEHRFFEGISVTGGLLMLALYGPGEISLDKGEKSW